MRVLITGSRSWTSPEFVWDRLDELWEWRSATSSSADPMVVVEGGAVGVDTFAHEWAKHRYASGARVGWEQYKPYDDESLLDRNKRMVSAGADVCMGFIRTCGCTYYPLGHGSHGASHCAEHALRAGMVLHVWREL